MFVKLALFLAVAFCSTQGLHASSVESDSTLDTYGITDIINSINNIIRKIQSAILDMLTTIPKLIKNLRKQIKEIIASINVWAIVDVIEDAIEDILAVAGIDVSGARTCLDAERAAVDEMVEVTTAAVEQCERSAIDSTEKLQVQMDLLKNKAFDLIREINTGSAKCMRDHFLNPIKLLRCLTRHLADVTVQSNALVLQIAKTIATATRTATQVTITLTKCTARITSDLVSRQAHIIGDFSRCVASLK